MSISRIVMCRVHTGGVQRIGAVPRASPKPQTIITNPISRQEGVNAFPRPLAQAGDRALATALGEYAGRVQAEEDHQAEDEKGHECACRRRTGGAKVAPGRRAGKGAAREAPAPRRRDMGSLRLSSPKLMSSASPTRPPRVSLPVCAQRPASAAKAPWSCAHG